jgi:hypothetical protein
LGPGIIVGAHWMPPASVGRAAVAADARGLAAATRGRLDGRAR